MRQVFSSIRLQAEQGCEAGEKGNAGREAHMESNTPKPLHSAGMLGIQETKPLFAFSSRLLKFLLEKYIIP